MKKFNLFLILVMLSVMSLNKTYAAFPVKEKISSATIVQHNVESGKIALQESNDMGKSELEAAAAAGGGGSKQILAAVLAAVVGGLGVHDFVLGNTTKGLIHLGLFALGLALVFIGMASVTAGAVTTFPLLSLIGTLILMGNSIWVMIDFVRILMGNYPGIE
jgi:TM2 domain-containing membrane protein YozV